MRMKVVTAEEMRAIDTKTIEEYGIAGSVLMEKAGLAVMTRIKEIFGRKRIIVMSGSGNNGGDGLVVARNLHNEGWDVRVFLTCGPEDLSADALSQYKAAIRFGVSIGPAEDLLVQERTGFAHHALIVDALLGTGLGRPVEGRLSEVISVINRSGLPVVSVDIPSGISSDNGQVMGTAVRADCTVTFGLPKRGHLLHPGAEFSGKLFVEDIGFPRELCDPGSLDTELIERTGVSALIPGRRDYSNKGDYGRVLIVAGSKGKTGAALMAAQACLRAGAGLVTLGVPESLADVFQSRVTEEMVLPLPDRGDGTLSEKASDRILEFSNEPFHVLAVGPGIGVSRDTEKLMRTLIKNSKSPMVIDADGLNSLKGERRIFAGRSAPIILTPHPGEMARLLQASGENVSIQEIEKDRIGTAVDFAGETKTFVLLKGVPTVVATPEGKAFLNPTGNPGMATAGAGDVLTGILAGLLAQNGNPLQSCILGVYLHGLAGDIAESGKGQHSLVATDIIQRLPDAFVAIKSGGNSS
jgi:NAD(P)H-hydrate epimerase